VLTLSTPGASDRVGLVPDQEPGMTTGESLNDSSVEKRRALRDVIKAIDGAGRLTDCGSDRLPVL